MLYCGLDIPALELPLRDLLIDEAYLSVLGFAFSFLSGRTTPYCNLSDPLFTSVRDLYLFYFNDDFVSVAHSPCTATYRIHDKLVDLRNFNNLITNCKIRNLNR